MTPTRRGRAARGARVVQPIDQRALAGAGRSGDADQVGAAGVAEDRPHQIGAGRIFVLDQRDRAGDGARIARQHALGQRRGHRRWQRHRDEQLPRDDQPLDLARAFADRGQLDVAEVLLGRIVLHEAVAAVDLHAVVGDLHGDLARIQLRHRRLERRPPAAAPSGTRRDRSAAAPPRCASRCRRASTESPGSC